MWKTSGLSSYAFTEFVRIFNLDNLGELGLAAQELAITGALGEHVLEGPEAASLQLQKLVRDYSLPEARGEAITRTEVLARLGSSEKRTCCRPPRGSWHRTGPC